MFAHVCTLTVMSVSRKKLSQWLTVSQLPIKIFLKKLYLVMILSRQKRKAEKTNMNHCEEEEIQEFLYRTSISSATIVKLYLRMIKSKDEFLKGI